MATHPKVRFADDEDMERVLIEQEQFLQQKREASTRVQQKPKKESIFAQRLRENAEKQEKVKQGTVDFEQIVGNVVERDPNVSRPPNSKFIQSKGFPEAVHRSVKAFKSAPAVQTVHKEEGVDPVSLNQEIEVENKRVIEQMSQSQIEEEVAEVSKQLDPALLTFLKQRAEKKYGKPTVVESSQSTPKPNPPITKSDKQVLEEKAKLEESKLVWTRPIEPQLPSPNDKDIGVQTRFDLQGKALSKDEAESLPTHLALHHHGEEPGLAGYTLVELMMLVRSTVAAQRSMALSTLAGIIRSNKYEYVDWLLEKGLLEWTLHAMAESAITEATLALELLLSLVEAYLETLPPSPILSVDVWDGWMDHFALSVPDIPELPFFDYGKDCGWQWSAREVNPVAIDRFEAPELDQVATTGNGLWPRRTFAPIPFEHEAKFSPKSSKLLPLLKKEPSKSLLLHGLKTLLASQANLQAMRLMKLLAPMMASEFESALLPSLRTLLVGSTWPNTQQQSLLSITMVIRLLRIMAIYGDAQTLVTSGIIQICTRFLSSDVTHPLACKVQHEVMLLIATTLDGAEIVDVDKLLNHLNSAGEYLFRLTDERRASLYRMLQSIVLAFKTPSPDVAISMRTFVEMGTRLLKGDLDDIVRCNVAYFLAVFFEKLGDPFDTLLDDVKTMATELVQNKATPLAATIRLARVLIPESEQLENLLSTVQFEIPKVPSQPSHQAELEWAKGRVNRWLAMETLQASKNPPLDESMKLISSLKFGEETWYHRLVKSVLFAKAQGGQSDLAPLLMRIIPRHEQTRKWRSCPLPILWPTIPLVELSKPDVVTEKDVILAALEFIKSTSSVYAPLKTLAAERNLALSKFFLIELSNDEPCTDLSNGNVSPTATVEEQAYRDSDLVEMYNSLTDDTPPEFDAPLFSTLLHSYLTTSYGDVNFTLQIIRFLQVDNLDWWKEFWSEVNSNFASRWLAIVSSIKQGPKLPVDSPTLADEGLASQIFVALGSLDDEDVEIACEDGEPFLLTVAKDYIKLRVYPSIHLETCCNNLHL